MEVKNASFFGLRVQERHFSLFLCDRGGSTAIVDNRERVAGHSAAEDLS